MEKVLRLYKIPDVGDIVTVIGVGISLPQTGFSAGDLFIDSLNETLYEAQSSGGTLSWVQVSFDSTKYYRDGSKEVPVFYTYSVQDGLEEYDVSFPQNADRAAEITSFTYSATRMGNAPTISGTLMYRECLDELWDDRVCVYFNKKFYFIDKIPTSEYNNTDERYKHSCEFVSENKLLENVYFTNVVDIENYEEDITKLPMQWLDFTFFSGISEFVARLNLSLAYSGLDAQHVGFKVVKDTLPTVEKKLITISNTTLKAALDMIYETWGIPYWFDGYTIHVGYSNEQQMQQAGVTMPTFQYGAVQSLLSLQKSQSNDIVNRITGFGSSENIPVFYPNKNPNAIEIQYERNQTLMLDYAKIANPYKTVKLEPSDAFHQGVPNGSYFKYMPIIKTYNYGQFVTINEHREAVLSSDDNGEPLIAFVPLENPNIKVTYTPLQSTDGSTFSILKKMFIWLGNVSPLSILVKDHTGQFPLQHFCQSGEFVACPIHCTREEWEQISAGTRGYSYSNPKIQISYTHNSSTTIVDGVAQYTENYYWSDGTYTEGYDKKFPINLENFNYCESLLISHKITFPRSAWIGEIGEQGNSVEGLQYNWEVFLKNDTRASASVTFLDEENPDWSLNADGHAAQLWRYGIRLNANATPQENDLIYFTRESGALPYFGQLLPYSFRETNDIWLNAKNNYYPKEDGQSFYTFENLYKISCAKEHVENFDEIKPTIKGMVNNETPAKRIDQILDVAFDQNDNNDLMENGTDYQHPYFFVKLAKTSLDNGYGFNLFDCAVDGQTMQINMADGNCGGCTFEVMVKYQSDGMAYNPVGVFTQATTINGVTYPAGSPKRNLQTGDVLVNRKEDIQRDTSAAEVWIALKKDNETFGNYDNGAEVVLPDSKRGENFIPEEGDSFTIINICLPYAYIVAAEQRLYHALLDYMEKNNPRTWSFSVKFSSIYYKRHYDFMDKWFNESSEVPFVYNGITRKYFVQSYSYKMSNNSALPEVTVELSEKVKKRNIFYPVPNNLNIEPYATYNTQQQQKALKKIVSVYMSGFSPANIEAENLHVNGDVTLANGTSLKGQITAINSQIFANEKINTRENAWEKIKKRAEIENLFVDGVFATDYNQETTSGVRITHNGSGIAGNNSMNAVFEDNTSHFTFKQKVLVEELSTYTFAFYVKSSNGLSTRVTITQYDNQDISLDRNEAEFGVENTWSQKAFFFNTAEDANYIVIQVGIGGDETAVSVDIDGVSVYQDNYISYDQGGKAANSSMLPTQYKMSTADIFNAIYKLGGGGSSSDEVLVCTFANNTVDKTPQEIYDAYSAGKVVVLFSYVGLSYLVNATYSSTYNIWFCTVNNPQISTPSFHYFIYNGSSWYAGSTTIQKELVSGTNIKTINGNSVLGSGNLTTFPSKYVIFEHNATGNTITLGTSQGSTEGYLNTISIHHITGSQQTITARCSIAYDGMMVRMIIDNSSNTNNLTITLFVYLGSSYIQNQLLSPSLQTTSGWEIQAGGMAEFEITADSNIAVIKRNF